MLVEGSKISQEAVHPLETFGAFPEPHFDVYFSLAYKIGSDKGSQFHVVILKNHKPKKITRLLERKKAVHQLGRVTLDKIALKCINQIYLPRLFYFTRPSVATFTYYFILTRKLSFI